MALSTVQAAKKAADFENSVSATFASSVTAGNYIIIGITQGGWDAFDVSHISDTAGNTYTRLGGVYKSSSFMGLEVWAAQNVHGGSTTITVFDDDYNLTGFIAYELAGIPFGGRVLDSLVTTQGTGGTITATLGAPTHNPDELLVMFGAIDAQGGTWTAGSGYGNLQTITVSTGSTFSFAGETQVVATTGTYSGTLTQTITTDDKVGILVALDATALYNRDEGAPNTGISGMTLAEKATLNEGSSQISNSNGLYTTVFSPLVQKDYEYRVYDHSYNFVGLWQDVTSEFNFSQAINENASELTVDIARAPDNLIVKVQTLQDTAGASILDTNSDPVYVQTASANAVGAGSDVELNYNVDVYAYYGGYEQLLDENSNAILDTASDPIYVQYGSPNGKRVYSGYLADYELTYGEKTGVRAIIVPHATEMSHYVFKNGLGETTVSYNSVDPVVMARDAMTNYISQGGIVTWDTSSMPLSGEVNSYDFKLQSTRESVDKTIDLLPSGYYHFVDVGERKQYILNKSLTAKHTFYYEKHITELKLRKSITQLVNDIYYIGGDTGSGVDLYVHSVDTASKAAWRPGLDRKADSRVTLQASAEALSQQEIDQFNVPRYRTTVTISDAVYDIENIKLGEMVGFKNFGTFLDSVVLQIVNFNKSKHTISLDLDMIVPSDTKRLYELKKELLAEQVRNIADSPT